MSQRHPIHGDSPHAAPDVRLDRSLAFDGSTTTGSYPGLDRFGRVTRHTWADGAIAAGSGSGAGYPTIPPIVSLGFSYDKNGNILEKWDARPGAKRSDDWEYELDDLDRLAEAKKGQHGSTYPTVAGSQQWALDVIGNWDQHDLDLVTLGSYGDNGDTRYEGDFTAANELDSLDETLFPASPTTLDLVYDKAGNLREQPLTTSTSRRFTHDAWGRVVKIETGSGSTWATKGEYEYNGLSMRCVKRLDDPDDATSGLDEQRLLYYSGQWQIVEEHVDDAWTSGHTTDRIVQHVWGLRYIDDLVLSREDGNADGDYDDAGDSTRYALTDHQFSVIALISDTGTLLERVTYTPYGEARHQWREDVDGDGDVDSADRTAASGGRGNIYQSSYNVDADVDRDGDVDSADLALINTPSYKSALATAVLSASGVGNTFGFCGYVFNPEIGGSGIYTVRFRHYDPALGRWLERDPAGYVDSMSLYGYGWGNPVVTSDPFGLLFGARTLRDPDLRNDPWIKPVADELHRAARDTRIAIERILEIEAMILREVAILVATGGIGNVAGRSLAWLLPRLGPAARVLLRWLDDMAWEGARVVVGGLVLVFRGGKWIIEAVAKEGARVLLEATPRRKIVNRAGGFALGVIEAKTTPPGEPVLPIPHPTYIPGWAAGQLHNFCSDN